MVTRFGTPSLAVGALVALASAAVLVAPCHAEDELPATESAEVALSFKTYRSFDLHLPAEQWHPVAAGLELPQAPDGVFRAELDGTALALDTDGDGELDVTIESPETRGAATLVKLRGKDDAGRPTTYSIRVIDSGRGWVYSASGAARGRIGNTAVRIVDQNGDGRFDGFGEDALVLGGGRYATFLSRAVHVDGELQALEVAADGASLQIADFDGPTGRLDLGDAFESRAKPLTFVLRSTDGAYSFDLSGSEGEVELPVGEYELHSGLFGLGEGTVAVRKGRSEALTIESGKTATAAWGGPVKAEFSYARAAGEITFDPAAVWFYGRHGEEYHSWLPYGKAPEFVVKERETAEEILRVKFPGSC